MRRYRTYFDIAEPAGQLVLDQVLDQRRKLAGRLSAVRYVVPVVSGKGGVGKSAITANVAALMAARGKRVGVVDADLNGPSLARMLGAATEPLRVTDRGIRPAATAAGVSLVSMDLLLGAEDSPLRFRGAGQDEFLWRGALETGALREFLADMDWGELDYLFIDLPPGTDRIERLLGLIEQPAAVLLVVIPTTAAVQVVARSRRLLEELDIQRIGLVLNMSSHRCSVCGGADPLFRSNAATEFLGASGTPPWGEIPFDPELSEATDEGRPFALEARESAAGRALAALADRLEQELAR